MKRLTVEPVAITFGANATGEEAITPFFRRGRSFISLLHFYIFHKPVVGLEIIIGGHRVIFNHKTFGRAVENLAHSFLREIGDRCLYCISILFADCINLPEHHSVSIFSQRNDSPFMNRKRGIGNYFLSVNYIDIAKTLAARTGTKRRIEGKIMRSRLPI